MGRIKRIHKMPEVERALNEMFEMFIAEKKRNRSSPDTIRSRKDNPNSPSPVNHYSRETRAFLSWCQEHCGMERFPVSLVRALLIPRKPQALI